MQQDFISLISWSEQFNMLPWRHTRSLYRTLISEIMLQQTTVATVLNKFESFLLQYPSIIELASATEEEILIAWKGLGYYRRAKNLLAAAKYITSRYNSNIPVDYHQLIAIPGIGDYTANAMIAIGANKRALAVDTNIERVVTRYYGLDETPSAKPRENILKLFKNNQIFKIDISSRALNEALMDLGRECCTSNKVNCGACPLQKSCVSKDKLSQNMIALKKQKKATYELALLRVLIIDKDSLFCYQKSENEWLAGQWECPTFIVKGPDDLKQYPRVVFNYEHLQSVKTTITKYKISNYIIKLTMREFRRMFSWQKELCKMAICEYNNYSTATQKALNLFRS